MSTPPTTFFDRRRIGRVAPALVPGRAVAVMARQRGRRPATAGGVKQNGGNHTTILPP